MNLMIFFPVIIVLNIIYFTVGIIASRNVSNNEDYFLAGRNLGFFAVTFTLIATQLGGSLIIGGSDAAFKHGYSGILYAVGIGIGFLLLALGFASKLQSMGVATVAEIFETKYNSPRLKQLASLISIISLFGILIAAAVMASKELITTLGASNELFFLFFWGLVIFYTMAGGLQAVTMTDAAQVIFIIISIGSIFLYDLWCNGTTFFTQASVAKSTGLFTSYPKAIITFIAPALFSIIEQDIAQKFFATKNKKTAVLSALCAGIFIIAFGFIPVYYGMKAKMLGLAIPTGGSPFVSILEQQSSEFIFVLIICGIIAAIVSTADSLLCAISSNIAQDFNISFFNFNKLTISKILTAIVGVCAVAASYLFEKEGILNLTVESYVISVACTLIPILFVFFKKEVKKRAAIFAFTFGLGSFIILKFFVIPGIPSDLAAILISLIGYLIGDLI
ncbi:MAG: hypothetical protein UR26_C0001G0202 [candidate division TM6 bacterium GW2011_GWF2_32_72]|nr:MAG: hypothetical protein UR26_C0001G0202 [candidate division TM6 bacterium GW2011_GWF2_32_72]